MAKVQSTFKCKGKRKYTCCGILYYKWIPTS